jgi:predicted MFS family arabinose efflux permease
MHGWAWAWWWLALACALATVALVWPARFFMKKEALALVVKAQFAPENINTAAVPGVPLSGGSLAPHNPPSPAPSPARLLRRFAFALGGYACFGVGYIGYMTFVIALLRGQGVAAADVTLFYALLGLAVVASGRLWAGLLDRARGGGALALLNALLGVAIVLPAVTTAWPLLLLSGLMFGGVFLSVVASTTALVRHNLPVAQWPAGISLFTIVFAVGQIFGPSAVGWIADGPGGLARGLLVSAFALWLGALLAWRQQPLLH